MDISKYKEMLASLVKQEEEVKATFTKIQGAKEVVQALLAEAEKPEAPAEEPKEESMKVSKIDKEKPKEK